MALTIERRMGIRLGAWVTVKTAIALGLWLALSQFCWAQDPLNDVHVNPPPPAASSAHNSRGSEGRRQKPQLPWRAKRH